MKANPEVHRNTTGPEILEQMEGKIDAFVATAGTGGTITGTGEYLKSHLPDLFIAVVEPEKLPRPGGRQTRTAPNSGDKPRVYPAGFESVHL